MMSFSTIVIIFYTIIIIFCTIIIITILFAITVIIPPFSRTQDDIMSPSHRLAESAP